jgi:biotin operon repressor
MTKSEGILLNYILIACKGKENAQTGKEIAKVFSCNKRDIQKQIESLRDELYPILSSDSGDKMGYYYPSNEAEIIEGDLGLRELRKRALKTLKTASNIRKGLAKISGKQLEIEELEEVLGL